jgi:hypothetical protein
MARIIGAKSMSKGMVYNLANSSVTSKEPFPKGRYKVYIYINDKLARTVEYEIV